MTYRIHALPLGPFTSLFDRTDSELETMGARRMTAEQPNSAPCRVSLVDAEPGERLILVNHRHLDVADSPYRAEGPIFVREAALDASPEDDQVPDMLARRLLSVRAYDSSAMMTEAEVVEGVDLDDQLQRLFSKAETDIVHIHTARRGCYLAAARRT